MLVAALALLVAAPPDSTLESRNLNQQVLAVELFQDAEPPESAEALDQALDRLAGEWAARTEGESDAYRRLNVYVPMWTALQVLGLEDEGWAECHTWARYAVPAFLADVATLDAGLGAPTTETAHLVRRSDVDWVTSPALRCDLDAETWTALAAAVERYPDLVGRYLDAGVSADDEHRAYLASVRRQAAAQGPVFDVLGRLHGGDLDGAFAALAVLSADGPAWAAAPLSGRLAEAYAEAGGPDRALATLDLAARSFSRETLPRDTLRAWYLRADAERGHARFAAATADPTAEFAFGTERADLSGTFTDVMTGEPVDLSTLAGRTVLLDFWSVGCGPCFAEIPALVRLDERDDLVVVAVSSDVGYGAPAEAVRAKAEETGMDYLVVHDSDDRALMRRFGVVGWPTHLLVAPDGRLLTESREGRAQLSLAEVERYLDAVP